MATAVGFPAEELKEANVAEWKDLVGTARCSRCGGLMVPEQCFDLRSDNGQLDFTAKRCVQCGDLVDPVILRNRRLRSPVC
jgi:ferredoxin-like protein FixX